jgi:MFS family permease
VTAPTTRSWALPLTATAQFVLSLDFSIVNVALATIRRDLGFSTTGLQWVATGYALTFGALLLVGGRLGDRFGHRATLIVGLVIFGVTSLAGGLAPSAAVLVAARLCQGAGAALIAPAALSLLNQAYDDAKARTRAMSLFQGSVAVGGSAGIVFGGLLTGLAGWRWVLLVNVPIVAVLIILILTRLPKSEPHRETRVNVTTALLITAAMGALILGVTEGQDVGFAEPRSWAAFAACVLAASGFIALERRNRADPMLPPNILRGHIGYVAATGIVGVVVGGYVYFVALYLQEARGFSALATGFALLPATGTAFLVSTFLARQVLPRLGPARQLVIAFASIGLGQLWLSTLHSTSTYPGGVLIGIVLTAGGLGLALPAASVALTSSAPPPLRGVAGALFTTAQQAGSAIGLALLATVSASLRLPRSNTANFTVVFAVIAGLSATAFAIMAVTALRDRAHRHAEER